MREDMFHSLSGLGGLYLLAKHLSWTKGGAAAWSPEVFSLAAECFLSGALSVRAFKGKPLFQKQESATNNMATHGPPLEEPPPPPPPPPAPLQPPTGAKREHTQPTVRVCVCNSRSMSTWRRFDCADVACVSFLSFFFNGSFMHLCFIFYLQTRGTIFISNAKNRGQL